jgi:hypothetical protein
MCSPLGLKLLSSGTRECAHYVNVIMHLQKRGLVVPKVMVNHVPLLSALKCAFGSAESMDGLTWSA